MAAADSIARIASKLDPANLSINRLKNLLVPVITVLWVIFAILLADTAAAQPDYQRFQLFNRCGPMGLTVERLGSDALEIGLREDAIQAAAESRLRSARLYNDDVPAYLYVNIHVVGAGFSIRLSYKRRLFDPKNGTVGFATTWHKGSTGTHGRDAMYILSGLSEGLDKFISAYLRVNEAHCGGP